MLASFCTDPMVATQFAQEKLVKILLELLVSPATRYESSLDCCRILIAFGQTEKGQQVRQLDPKSSAFEWCLSDHLYALA